MQSQKFRGRGRAFLKKALASHKGSCSGINLTSREWLISIAEWALSISQSAVLFQFPCHKLQKQLLPTYRGTETSCRGTYLCQNRKPRGFISKGSGETVRGGRNLRQAPESPGRPDLARERPRRPVSHLTQWPASSPGGSVPTKNDWTVLMELQPLPSCSLSKSLFAFLCFQVKKSGRFIKSSATSIICVSVKENFYQVVFESANSQ